MARPVQAEDAITEYFEGLINQRVAAEVGLLIGKPVVGSRSLLLAVVPSPEQEGQPAVTISATGAASSSSSKGKKGGGGGGGATARLEPDWIAEHARQVSRMMPGGLEVLGLYLLAPEAAWGSAVGQMCSALATMAADASSSGGGGGAGADGGPDGGARGQLLLLHVDATTRKMTARACACEPAPSPSSLKVVDLRSGSAAGSLVRLTARHTVDALMPALAGANRPRGERQLLLQQLAESLVDAEAARLAGAVVALGGGGGSGGAAAPLSPGDVLGDLLPPEAGLGSSTEAQIYCAPAAAAAAAAAGAAGAAPLLGATSLRGDVCSVAFVHKREPAARALSELKADIVKSLRTRLELLVEEALAAAEEQEDQQQQGKGQQQQAVQKPAAHPLLLPAAAGRPARLSLPRRVLMPWRVAGGAATVQVCDYLAEGEGVEAAAGRAQELLGLGDDEVDPSKVEVLEAPAGVPPAKAAGTAVRGQAADAGGDGGGGAACSSTMVAGLATAAAAAVAVAVAYMGLGSN